MVGVAGLVCVCRVLRGGRRRVGVGCWCAGVRCAPGASVAGGVVLVVALRWLGGLGALRARVREVAVLSTDAVPAWC